MSTDLEQLHAWMERTGHDAKALAHAMYFGRSVANFLNGKRAITDRFRWYFGREFGRQAMFEVFGIDLRDHPNCFRPGGFERYMQPEQNKARAAVAVAIRDGEMPRCTDFQCAVCTKDAVLFHHESYLEVDWLNVIPLCRSCHVRRHRSGLQLPPLGVVPTQVGLVRIAIASPVLP